MKHIHYFFMSLTLGAAIPCLGAAKGSREERAAQMQLQLEQQELSTLVREYKRLIKQAMEPVHMLYERAQKDLTKFKQISDDDKKSALAQIEAAIMRPILTPEKAARQKKPVSVEQEARNRNLASAINDKSPEGIANALANGADPNALIHGEPAIMPMMRKSFDSRGIDNVINTLRRHGLNIDAQSEKGYTALQRALIDDIRFVEPILKLEPDVTIADDDGNTALHYAVKSQIKGFEFIPELIKRGAHVNAQNNAGESPLIYAAKRISLKKQQPNEQAIDALIAAGANPLLRDKSGKEAIDYLEKFPALKKKIEEYRQKFESQRQSIAPEQQKKEEKGAQPVEPLQHAQGAEISVEA